jgi:predicted amidohydrolase YtcJ
MSQRVLIREVTVNGQAAMDVRVVGGTIVAVGRTLSRHRDEAVVEGRGGALIPGLHDHHVHLRSAVASRQSTDVSRASSQAEFDQIVAGAAATAGPDAGRWLRVIGWEEHAGGPLDRYRLDALTGSVPIRVQHRNGAMWVLNSAAVRRVGVDDCKLPGVERDSSGRATGRLLRMDAWLRGRIPPAAQQTFAAGVAAYATEAARLGVTGFTDATPGRDQADVDEFTRLSASGLVPQLLMLMVPPGLSVPGGGQPGTARVRLGPVKVMLDDVTLPSVGELSELIAGAHRAGSRVAVHCVTAEQLVVAVAALAVAGTAADRIEHAGVVPPGYASQLASLRVTVVTQPGFVGARGDDYLRDSGVAEREWLYPCASLIRAGVLVAAGTDAPFGPADPWQCIASATTRRTALGQIMGSAERVPASRALRLFLADSDDLVRIRTVALGQPADLCLLHTPLAEMLARPSAELVRATIIGGRLSSEPD